MAHPLLCNLYQQFILIQRGVHAKETLQVNNSIRKADSSYTIFRFEELEKRIDRMDAEADLCGHSSCSASEKTFRDMEMNKSVDKELEALKKNSQLAPSAK